MTLTSMAAQTQRLFITFTLPLLVLLLMIFNSHAFSSVESSESQYHHPPYTKGGVKAVYWFAGDPFSPSSTDTNYFTHIYYAFLEPDPDSFKLNVTDSDQKWIPEFINGLRTLYPPVKTLLSIGGGGRNTTVFSTMASTNQTRQIFINSTIQVAREYGFDGLDLDWEYPDTEQDMANLALLLGEWHQALVLDARIHQRPRLLLTAAVYYASTVLNLGGNGPRSYPAQAISEYLDWASPMCYDYHGSWHNYTGLNSALLDPKSNVSTYYGIGSWIQSGVPPEKLVMGLALYGRTWKLQDPNVNGLGAPALGAATDTDGTMDYDEILKFNEENGATVVYDELGVSYYTYAGTTWISYDDGPTIIKKVLFAKSLGLGGYFFWALGEDKDWSISRQASNAWGY